MLRISAFIAVLTLTGTVTAGAWAAQGSLPGTVIKRGVTIPKDAPRFVISMAEQTASKCANGERPQCHIASCLKCFSHNPSQA